MKNNTSLAISLAMLEKTKLELLQELPTPIPGPRGKQGLRGERGFPGANGKDGRDGKNGVDGKDGVDGKTGLNGKDGVQGEPGKDGTQGPKGDKGEPGKDGVDGKDGLNGKDGVDGKNGVDGKAGARGPKGESGKNGLNGKDGIQGKAGRDGKDGINGVDGLNGKPGRDGKDGLNGKDGAQGPKGDKGEPGKDGVDGKDININEVKKIINQNLDPQYKQLDKWKANVQKALSSMGGGGSYKILDNADVEKTKLSDAVQNAILIFDAAKQKFVVTDLQEVLSTLQVGLELQYTRLVDVEGLITYIGEATPGENTADAVWRIKRVEEVGDDINIEWANGTADFVHIWDNRLTYSYS